MVGNLAANCRDVQARSMGIQWWPRTVSTLLLPFEQLVERALDECRQIRRIDAVTTGAYAGWDIGAWTTRGHEVFHLAFALLTGQKKPLLMILFSQVRPKQLQCSQMDASSDEQFVDEQFVDEQFVDEQKSPHQPGCAHTLERITLAVSHP